MATFSSQLARLGRLQAGARAGRWAVGQHVKLLLVAVLLAALTRWVLPVPGLAALVGRFVPVALLALGLWLALPVLKLLARPWLTPSPARLARHLDDERGWKDAAGTALDVEAGRAGGALAAVLTAQVAGWVDEEPVERAAPAGGRPWLRLALTLVFVVLLLLPGVSGRGGQDGAGRGGEIGPGWREDASAGPLDADRWMREHARLVLEPLELADEAPKGRLRVLLRTGLPLPATFRGELALLWDERVLVPLREVTLEAGAPARFEQELDVRDLAALKEHLTPGTHKARVRLAPLAGPFQQALRSNVVEVEIEPPGPGGGGAGGGTPPPQPPPTPPPEPPPSEARPDEGPKATPPPPSGEREEAVTPFINEGERVKKEQAVVAVRDPEAGLKPPPSQPLPEALRDFDKVVESAVSRERIAPQDRELVRRYFATLRRLTEPAPR